MQISHDARDGGDRDADDRIDRNGKVQMQMIETTEAAKMDEGDRPKDGDAGGHEILSMLEY